MSNNHTHPTQAISTVEAYRLLIEGDLLALIRQAIDLEREQLDSEEYSDRRQNIQNQLYDLYQEIGWSVVYDMRELPF